MLAEVSLICYLFEQSDHLKKMFNLSSIKTLLPVSTFFFLNDTATTEISTLPPHAALPINTSYGGSFGLLDGPPVPADNTDGPLRRLSDNRLQLASNSVIGGVRLETKSQWQRHSLQEVSDQSRNGDSTPNFDLLLNTYSTDVLLHHSSSGGLTGTVGVSGLYQDNQTRA